MREMDNLFIKENYFKNVMMNFGKHYYYATLFFPPKIKNQVFIIYAFVRRLDNIVDDKNLNLQQKKEKFNEWIIEWQNVLIGKKSKFEELNFFYQIIKDKNIDLNFVNAFINSMYFDLSKVRIKNYNELEKYMFGSATVVGYFMLYVFDAFNEITKEYAQKLAQAMQLTNFIRDIKEDLILDRIYLPLEDAQKYNISEKDFFYQKFNQDFRKFIKYYVDFAQNLYVEANKGIKYLPKYARLPVLYASNLYRSILDEIMRNNYNVFDFNYQLNKIKEIFIFFLNLYSNLFSKGMNKKRAIIIGSGLGGLSLGILLAKKDFKVQIFEKNENFGGRVNFFKESGHMFDMGPSWLLMLDIFEYFYKLIGEDINKELNLVKLDPSFKIYFYDKEAVTIYGDLEKNKNNFENLEIDSYNKIQKYIDLQEEIYNTIKERFIFNEFNIKNLINYQLLKKFFKFNPFLTADKYLRKIFKNEKLLKILEFDFLFLGTNPKIAPSVYGIINYFLFKQGIFYPKGGIYKIVESFIRIGKKLGIEYYNNSEVSEILIEKDRAFGVKLSNNQIFEADYVISNADLYHTEMDLIKDKKYRTYDKDYWINIKIAPSGFILYLGLNQKIKDFEHHNFYFSKDWDLNFKQIFNYNNLPDDPSFYICMPSKTDDSISPQNKDQLFILVPISSGSYLSSQKKEWFRDKIYEIIEQKMNIKNFKEMIEFERIYTIDDFKKDYNSLDGTALGIIHDLGQTIFRPKNKSKKVKNLYYVGAYVNPGIGMPMVVSSAIITYKKILYDLKKNLR